MIAVVAAFTGLAFVGCSKSDDNGKDSQEQLLIGKWRTLKSEQYDFGGKLISTEYPEEDGCPKTTTEFLSNKTVKSVWFNKLDGKCIEESSNNTKWNLHNNILTSSELDGTKPKNLNVLKLSNTELQVEYIIKKGDTDYELNVQKEITYLEKVK